MKEAVTRLLAPATPGTAVARRPPSKPMSTTSTRRSRASARPAAARAMARRASSRGARRSSSSSRSAEPGGSPAVADGHQQDLALARRLRTPRSGRAPRPSTRRGSRSAPGDGRRPRRRGWRCRRVARRSSGPGGSPAPRRTASTVGSRSIDVIVNGSVVWGVAERSRQPLRRAASASGPTARSDAAIATRRCGRRAPGDQARQAPDRAGAGDSERSGELRVARRRPLEQETNDRVDIDAGRHRQRPDQSPSMANAGDEGNRRGGRAKVEGEEGSRVARHALMLPALPPGRPRSGIRPQPVRRSDGSGQGGRVSTRARAPQGASANGASRSNARMGRPSGDRYASQVISSSSSSSRAISCSIPASSARISEAPANPPPNRPRRTGSKKSIALAPSGR